MAAAESVAFKPGVGDPARASGWNAIPEGLDPDVLRRAVRGARVLRLRYVDAAGMETHREVLPLDLTYFVEAQVLGAWCRLRVDSAISGWTASAAPPGRASGSARRGPNRFGHWRATGRECRRDVANGVDGVGGAR